MKTIKVLLINPKSSNVDALPIPPLGLLYLASYARERGHGDIRVIDNNREDHPIETLADEISKADIVGLTGTTSQYKQAAEIADIAKRFKKLVVMGGPHATFLAEDILKHSNIDIVVVGEGEVAFFEILEEAANQQNDFSHVHGVFFKNNNGRIIGTQKRLYIKNLDELPFPARDLVPIKDYPIRELKQFDGPFTHMMSGRGCTSKCTFCSSPGMWGYARVRSAANVFKEMMEIYDRYQIKNIHFQDDSFTLARKRVIELAQLIIDSGIGFKWCCQARPDQVDGEMLIMMKKSGCVQIAFGVESGDERLLKEVGKGYTKEQICRAFYNTKKVGITTYGFFIVGLPGETLANWIKSIIFAKSLKMFCCVWTVLVPFPGTKVLMDKRIRVVKEDFLEWRYKNPIIKSGKFGPKSLAIMRKIADVICNGLSNTGTYKTKKK